MLNKLIAISQYIQNVVKHSVKGVFLLQKNKEGKEENESIR